MNAAGGVSLPSISTGAVTACDKVEPARIELDALYRGTVKVQAGKLINLIGNVFGKPFPTITWSKDGNELIDSQRISIQVNKHVMY